MNGNIHLFGQRMDAGKCCVRDGIRRVWSKSGRHQGKFGELLVKCQTTAKVLVLRVGPGCRHRNDRNADHCAHADPLGKFGRYIGKEIVVIETGRATPKHFNEGQLAAGAHILRADPALLGRPDMLLEPAHQSQVIGHTAHECHGAMGVAVDQTRNQCVAGQMNPLGCLEVPAEKEPLLRLWIRGGFPDSYLAESDADSFAYRANFIRTYLERDVPQFGPRIPAETLERLWTMLAHSQGGLLNAAKLGGSLSLTGRTISNYIDLLTDLLLVRRLQPWHTNTKKRLVKSPRVYVRDSGLVHALLGLADYAHVAGHPVLGMSWEGFVIENLLAHTPERTPSGFYRTSAGAEIDLVLQLPGKTKPWAIEIKYGLTPKPSRGFHQAIEDLNAERAFVVYSGDERFPLSATTEAIGLRELSMLLSEPSKQ